jgi:hypothetical protein
MKRVILSLYPSLLVDDDVDPATLANTIVGALTGIEGLESVVAAAGREQVAREGTCRVGPHQFWVDQFFPDDREVPDICRPHAYVAAVQDACDLHKPLFEEVERLTGLKGRTWQSGGMTMTMVFPVNEPGEGQDWSAPLYMGLVEDRTDDGEWYGSVQFFVTDADAEAGEGTDIVDSRGGALLTPAQWARSIAAHHATLPPRMIPRNY